MTGPTSRCANAQTAASCASRSLQEFAGMSGSGSDRNSARRNTGVHGPGMSFPLGLFRDHTTNPEIAVAYMPAPYPVFGHGLEMTACKNHSRRLQPMRRFLERHQKRKGSIQECSLSRSARDAATRRLRASTLEPCSLLHRPRAHHCRALFSNRKNGCPIIRSTVPCCTIFVQPDTILAG